MTGTRDIPAFPLAFQEHDASGMPLAEMYAHDGMTLRDYFAAKAMQGAMANCDVKATAMSRAEWAYEIADAMLAAREK